MKTLNNIACVIWFIDDLFKDNIINIMVIRFIWNDPIHILRIYLHTKMIHLSMYDLIYNDRNNDILLRVATLVVDLWSRDYVPRYRLYNIHARIPARVRSINRFGLTGWYRSIGQQGRWLSSLADVHIIIVVVVIIISRPSSTTSSHNGRYSIYTIYLTAMI